MKRIICLWGGPGVGKSTACAGIFNLLKKQGFNAEMNREYIKDWVWEGREIVPGDQSYIFTKQARKERIYMNQGLDFIISDSPMALSIIYGDKYDPYEKNHQACRALLRQHHDFCKDKGYKVDHFFLRRMKEYQSIGRLQTEEEAKQIDGEILVFLEKEGINYSVVDCDQSTEEVVVSKILEFCKNEV